MSCDQQTDKQASLKYTWESSEEKRIIIPISNIMAMVICRDHSEETYLKKYFHEMTSPMWQQLINVDERKMIIRKYLVLTNMIPIDKAC